MAPRTPLLRPDRYFAERDPSVARGVVLAVLFVAGTLAMMAVLGGIFTAKIDGTVMVDNPDRPSETFCDSGMNESFDEVNTTFGCDEPPQIERNIDVIVDRAIGQFYGPLLVGLPIVFLGAAGLLHLGTAMANGRGPFASTMTVAAWGFAPVLVTMPLALAALWLTMDPVTISPGTDPSAFESTLLTQIQGWAPIAFAFNAAGSLWGAAIWTFGLEHARNVSRVGAAATAIVVTALFLLVGAL